MSTPTPDGWPSGPPPQKVNGLKWLMIAVVALLVIAISVGGTIIFTRGDRNSGGTTPNLAPASDFASAGDTGPAAVITDEPTCTAFYSLNDGLAQLEPQGWGDQRATFGPVSAWTPEQRQQMEAVADSMRKAADQAVALAKRTPHRVIRELYEQFIAYGRAYADSLPRYVPTDNELASVNVNATSVLLGICNTIENGSTSRSVALESVAPPTVPLPPQNPQTPERFVTAVSPSCNDWVARLDSFNSATVEWQARDSSIPAAQWTAEQRAVVNAAEPRLVDYANQSNAASGQSNNPVFEDFAKSSALYIRAFVAADHTYTSADGWLGFTGFRFANLIASACRATAG